ncbi:unnamed protein product [Arabis nemorensis]|uniref:Ubiquitin-like protease family profile domain-containing protein n=1 Tax=Arabis nemorensis TaxID=586526 RepID=A0A565BIN2_9BRAS|nr:unnamed protein product [Arabis nemorensis]
MEVLVSLLQSRHKEILLSERATFASPWLINIILSKQCALCAAKNKKLLGWDERFRTYVNASDAQWLEEVETVYVPMVLDDKHWVGLAINLKMWLIEVLATSSRSEHGTQQHRYKPFMLQRARGHYKNIHSGDCGPLAMKLLELHANGVNNDEITNLTDVKVNELRKAYAMDIYTEVVLPLYFP